MLESFMRNLPDIIGVSGVMCILTAYSLLSMSKLSALDILYQLLNITGATAILISLYFHFNLSSFVIEIAWIMISLIGLYRIYKLRQQKNKSEE